MSLCVWQIIIELAVCCGIIHTVMELEYEQYRTENPSKLDDRGCKVGPDLVIEISSPGTAEHDLKDKFKLYQKTGVKEYWVVHPTDKTTMIFKLNDAGEYGRPDVYGSTDKVSVPLLGDLEMYLAEVFGFE